jgi:methionyl-tRNA synthetase
MRLIMKLADRANEYVDRMQPWKLAKEPSKAEELRDVCSVALNLYRQIVLYMSPVLPRLAEQSEELFGAPFDRWEVAQAPLTGVKLEPFKHLMVRVDPRLVKAMVDASVEESAPAPAVPEAQMLPPRAPQVRSVNVQALSKAKPSTNIEPILPVCSFEDFSKVDLRVAHVLEAAAVDGSRKLLRLKVSLGNEDRTIFAGIRGAYEPESLVGRLIIVVANLSPRQMKCGTSEGMALAAGGGDSEVFLLSPDSGAVPGQRVH